MVLLDEQSCPHPPSGHGGQRWLLLVQMSYQWTGWSGSSHNNPGKGCRGQSQRSWGLRRDDITLVLTVNLFFWLTLCAHIIPSIRYLWNSAGMDNVLGHRTEHGTKSFHLLIASPMRFGIWEESGDLMSWSMQNILLLLVFSPLHHLHLPLLKQKTNPTTGNEVEVSK